MKRHFNRIARQCAAVMLGAAMVFNAGDLFSYSGISVYAAGIDEASATAVQASDTEWNSGFYKVTENVKMNDSVRVNGNVTLILEANCKLTISYILVVSGNSLTIKGEGELVADATNSQSAGIGGHDMSNKDSGTIIIEGGTITAIGGKNCAGIGGAKNGSNGKVIIRGGTVTATGGDYAAGIGGGNEGSGGTIIIEGGTVNATGGNNYGAGIGGGNQGSGGTINISDGTVTAKGGWAAAGIGGGSNGAGGNITISGGTVTAAGGQFGTESACAGIGSGVKGSGGTFSTGNGGKAFIIATSGKPSVTPGISDTSNQTNWSGIIFQGNEGQVYSSPILNTDVEIPSGKMLTIPEGSTLTVAAGVELTNNGTLTVYPRSNIINNGTIENNGEMTVDNSAEIINNGTLTVGAGGSLTNNGTVGGDGTFTVSKITADMISVPTDLVYTGESLSGTILDRTKIMIGGHEFTAEGWNLSVIKKSDLLYTVNYFKDGETNVTKDVTVGKSGTDITATSNKTDCAYGETFTITATVNPSGEAPNAAIAMLADFTEPTDGQLAVYEGKTQVCAPVTPENGACTFTIPSKDLGMGEHTLTVKYVESTVMAGAESNAITVTVKPAALTITGAALAPKTYDGKTTATVTDVTFSGYVEGDSALTASDYTATAEFDNANAGENKTATVTVTLKATVKNYTLPQNNTVTLTDLTINKADVTLTFNDQTITYGETPAPATAVPAAEITYSYTGDAEGNGLPKNAGTYTVTATVTNTDNYNGTTATSKLTINKADNPPKKPGNAIIVLKSCEKVGGAELPEGWEWKYPETPLTVGGEAIDATACYVGADKDNYNNIEVIIKITRSECEHTNTEIRDAVPATCIEKGYSGNTYCLDCKQTISTGVETDLAAHTEQSEITKPATYTEEGTKTITCSVCGATIRTETIPKLTKPSGGEPSSPGTPSEPNTPDGPDTPDKPNDTKPDDKTDKPYIKGEDGKEGWDVIRAEVDTADNGGKITVEMNGTTEVPGDILNSIKGEDITITFDMGDGVSWSVNGKDVTEAAGTIDFGVKVGSSDIPVDVINNVTGENYSMQLSLNYDGNFGFKATLSVELGTESAGSYASLYYYNEQSGEPEFISESKITENGIANLEFTHASDYVIVVNEKSRFGEDNSDDTSDSSGNSTDSGDSSESSSASGKSNPSKNPHTGTNISYITALISATGVVGLFITMRRKKDRGC